MLWDEMHQSMQNGSRSLVGVFTPSMHIFTPGALVTDGIFVGLFLFFYNMLFFFCFYLFYIMFVFLYIY